MVEETDVINGHFLKESDIAGASLNGRNSTELKIPELKCWLQCCDTSTKGNKSDLVSR